ncbi:MAG: ATPase, T2SS/T4P/T4SS family [Candidatus Micrarchaeota archaeon]
MGLTIKKEPPDNVRRIIKTVVDNVLEGLSKRGGSITLEDIQNKHSKKVTQEHVERWAGILVSHGIAALERPTNPLDAPKLSVQHIPLTPRTMGKRRIITEVLDSYDLSLKDIPAFIEIVRVRHEFSPIYLMHRPEIAAATAAILDSIKLELSRMPEMKTEELIDPKLYKEVEEKFTDGAKTMISQAFPGIALDDKTFLADMLVINMLGLGDIDILMADNWIEDIAINNADAPIRVYHKKFGWLKTNLVIPTEKKIREMCEAISRRVGRQISNLSPLLDAHLLTGDRVNATLSVVSPTGNTLTIRRFARIPWTITDMMTVGNISVDMAAFIWLAIQYEMNFLVIGGTASGKTSLLNALLCFVPPNHRTISIEDTKELNLPIFAHWIPLVSRLPNPEGKGEVTMLDLMVNSLRMRPDRMVIGEVRTQKQAAVMFEAIHTGHSCYGTFHADNAGGALRRFTEPPISIPSVEMRGMHLLITQFRDRRMNRRRTSQIVELTPSLTSLGIELNMVYRWESRSDDFEMVNQSVRVFNELQENAGFSEKEIERDLGEKRIVLNWMVKNSVNNINKLGSVISHYYLNPERVLSLIRKGATINQIVE